MFSAFSSKGPEVNVAAPGGWGIINSGGITYYNDVLNLGMNVFSATPNYAFNIQIGTDVQQNYGYLAGTSMAAPMVTGVVALVLSVNPNLSLGDLQNLIQQTADDKGAPGRDDYYGWGRVNAFRAVSKANGVPAAPQNLQVSSVLVGTNPKRYSPRLTWIASPEGDVIRYRIYRRFTFSSWGKIDSVSAPATSYVDYSVLADTLDLAYYKITAVDGWGYESAYSNTVSYQSNWTSKPFSGGEPESQPIPTEFALKSNYPNPFNPLTLIDYQIPEDVHVTIKLFDMLGREMATLVDELKQAGTYHISFDASQLATGVYLYRMVAGSYSAVRKLVVVK